MNDRHRRAGARQEHEQPPGPHPSRAQHPTGDGVDAAKVVQEPCVGAKRAERVGEGCEIEAVEQRH